MRKNIVIFLIFFNVFIYSDTLYLKTGEILKGRVVKETEKIIYFKTKERIVNISRRDILSIKKRTAPEKKKQKKLSTPQLLKRAKKYQKDGNFIKAKKYYFEYLKHKPYLADKIEWEVACMAKKYGHEKEALKIVKTILQRNPNHPRAQAIVRSLIQKLSNFFQDDIENALNLYKKRRYRAALTKFIELTEKYPDQKLQEASKKCKNKFGAGIDDMMVDCRFNLRCPRSRCKNGVIRCARCRGSGRIRKFSRTVEREAANESNITQVYCPKCNGRGSFNCKFCKGTGFYFGEVTEFEKKTFVKVLVAKGSIMGKNAAKLFEKNKEKRQKDPHSWGISSYNIISLTRTSLYLLKRAVKENPAIGSSAGGNLNANIKQVELLRSNVFMTIALGYLAASEHSYQKAVNVSSRDTEALTLPARTMKAQEALSLAESSRLFLLQALDEDRSAMSPLRGDIERLLARVDEHIIRCRRTLALFRKAERGAITPRNKDIIKYIKDNGQNGQK